MRIFEARKKQEKMFQIFRQGEHEVLIASKARWDEQLKDLIELERRCLTLREEVEHLSEKQEVLADLMVSKNGMHKTAPGKHQEKIFEEFMELEEPRAKKALALVQKKHMLIKCEGKRQRARATQRLDASSAIGPWFGGHHCSSFGSCSSSLALHTEKAMSVSSKMAQDIQDAMSESSWTALAKGKERDWWSINLEGEVEKLEVVWDQRRLRGTQR